MDSENHNMTAAAEFAAVMGGKEITVTYTDGRTEKVKVCELGVDKLERYAAAIDDELKAADLFCDRADGWSKDLNAESFGRVMDIGQELNLPFFSAWLRRRLKRAEAANPGISKLISTTVNKAIESVSASVASSSPSQSGTAST